MGAQQNLKAFVGGACVGAAVVFASSGAGALALVAVPWLIAAIGWLVAAGLLGAGRAVIRREWG